ncbi:MAG: hypothetical protein QM661_15340, partial [Solimonas sp.]
RAALAALPPLGEAGLEATAQAIRRRLAEAEIDLAEGDADAAAGTAAAATAQARASELAPYLRLTIADGEWLEGLARLRGGDAARARPLLAQALATRTERLLPASPKIAEARRALADCERRLARPTAAIDAAHAAPSERDTTAHHPGSRRRSG